MRLGRYVDEIGLILCYGGEHGNTGVFFKDSCIKCIHTYECDIHIHTAHGNTGFFCKDFRIVCKHTNKYIRIYRNLPKYIDLLNMDT